MSASAFTAAEVAEARADLATMLPDLGTIQRKTAMSDGGGGQHASWLTVATALPCRLTPRVLSATRGAGGVIDIASRLDDATTHILTFTADVDVRIDDRAVVHGTTYEVLVVGYGGDWEIARHIQVRKAPA